MATLASRVRAVCNLGTLRHCYAGLPVQRPDQKLMEDPAFLAESLRSGRFLCFDSLRLKVDRFTGSPLWITAEQVESLCVATDQPSVLSNAIMLGSADSSWRFGVDVPGSAQHVADNTRFVDLRQFAARADPDESAVAGQARNLLHWHGGARFCGKCGGETSVAKAGWSRVCMGCAVEHFPRLDSVAIAAVLSPDGEQCLLGRQRSWPAGMYSCLAGFVDPGETFEAAVRREVFEEAGIRTGPVFYHSSQPWPNGPSPQVMVGTMAIAEHTDIQLNEDELEEARWFDRQMVAAAVSAASDPKQLAAYMRFGGAEKEGGPTVPLWLPPPMTIAHQLIKAWTVEMQD